MAHRTISALVALALLAGGIVAAPAAEPESPSFVPPPGKQSAAEREALFAALAAAKSDFEARAVEDRLWKFWLTPPDEESRKLLEASRRANLEFNYNLSILNLKELTEHAPDYSEGWNQLATVFFLAGAYDASLKAIERTLALEPKHYGALAGKGLIYLWMLGDEAKGQKALKEALAINPWLKERNLIKPEPGQKI